MMRSRLKMLLGQIVIEMKLFLRDRPSVFWTFFFPVMLILMFGFVFNRPDSMRFQVGLVDEDNSLPSQELLHSLVRIPALNVETGTRAEMTRRLFDNDLPIVIHIDSGYGDIAGGKPGLVRIHYNSDQQQLLQLVRGAVLQVVDEINWSLVDQEPLISVESFPEKVTKTDTGYISFLVPGLIAFSLMSTCLFSIGVVVVSYREKGKLRRLAVTPLPRSLFILGQMINRYVIVMLQALLLIALSLVLFEVRISGSVWQFFCGLTIGMMAFISLGYAIASMSKTTETASGIANTLFIPMTFLSGVYFPASHLPDFLQPLVEILPLTHLVRVVRGVFSYGESLFAFLPELLVLTLWMAACFLFALKLFKWE